MPHFHIQGDSDAFDNAVHVEVQGELSAWGFVTAERIDEKTVLLTEVPLADLQSYGGILFQVEYEEAGEDGAEEAILVNWVGRKLHRCRVGFTEAPKLSSPSRACGGFRSSRKH